MYWRESGGPPPLTPQPGSGGFGSTLMKRVIAGVRGQTEIAYPETGAEVRLTLPVDMLRPRSYRPDTLLSRLTRACGPTRQAAAASLSEAMR